MGVITLAIWITDGRPAIFGQRRIGQYGQGFIAWKFRTMKLGPGAGGMEQEQESAKGETRNAKGGVEEQGARSEGNESAKGETRNGKGEAEEQGARSEEQGDTRSNPQAPGSQLVGESVDDLYTREDDPRVTRLGRFLRKLRLDELPQLWNVFKGDMALIGPRAEWDKCVERYEKKIPFYHFRHLVKPGITGWAQVNYPYGESEEDALKKLQYDLYYIRHYSLKLDAMIVLKTVHTMLFGRGR
jgi:lipopolysaccharide/colanic/teichoic acid biosynthesis glycosyltransferase